MSDEQMRPIIIYETPPPPSPYVIQSILWLISCYLTGTAVVVQRWRGGRGCLTEETWTRRKRVAQREKRASCRIKVGVILSWRGKQLFSGFYSSWQQHEPLLCNSCLVTLHNAHQPATGAVWTQSISLTYTVCVRLSAQPAEAQSFFMRHLPDIPPPTTITS